MIALLLLGLQSSPHVEKFTVDGVERQAIIYDGVGEKRPVIFAFHGHGGNMRNSQRAFQAHINWPEAMVIYPQGLPTVGRTDPEGKKAGWQKSPGDLGDRDLKFFDAMLDSLKGIDKNRVYAMGHSNGGAMVYLLWAERGDKFAAFGPSGSPALALVSKLKPKPFFHTAGEKDPIVPFASQNRTLDALAKTLGADRSKAEETGYVSLMKGSLGIEMGTYIHPGGHEYPEAAAKATVEFFKRQSIAP
jgi:polyhydroxybutyrate depolymerase